MISIFSFIGVFNIVFGVFLSVILALFLVRDGAFHHKLGTYTFCLFVLILSFVISAVFFLNANFLYDGFALFFWDLISFFLLVAAFYDLFFRLIPIVLVFCIVFISFFTPLFFGFPLGFSVSAFGGLVAGGLVLFIYLITFGRGIGEADVFLAFAIGFLFGWMKGLLVFSMANMLGLVVFLPLIIVFGKKRMGHIPLVSFLVLAMFLEWHLGYSAWVIRFVL